MADVYDVVVIGGGPAGYVAAIRAAQLTAGAEDSLRRKMDQQARQACVRWYVSECWLHPLEGAAGKH